MKNTNKWCDTSDGAIKVLKIIGIILLVVTGGFLFGLVVMLLWNWLMPMIFGLPVVTYWQGLGVLALSCILFWRMGGSSEDSKKEKKGNHPIRDEIKSEIKKEFEKEFEKEKNKNKNKEENLAHEEMYEKWWEEEGENFFNNYKQQSENNNET